MSEYELDTLLDIQAETQQSLERPVGLSFEGHNELNDEHQRVSAEITRILGELARKHGQIPLDDFDQLYAA